MEAGSNREILPPMQPTVTFQTASARIAVPIGTVRFELLSQIFALAMFAKVAMQLAEDINGCLPDGVVRLTTPQQVVLLDVLDRWDLDRDEAAVLGDELRQLRDELRKDRAQSDSG